MDDAEQRRDSFEDRPGGLVPTPIPHAAARRHGKARRVLSSGQGSARAKGRRTRDEDPLTIAFAP